LGDLLKRPLDEITAEELDEMLNRYSSVIDDATRKALQQVLADRKKRLMIYRPSWPA
jgi:dsDNA-binding SOS-regulon protein